MREGQLLITALAVGVAIAGAGVLASGALDTDAPAAARSASGFAPQNVNALLGEWDVDSTLDAWDGALTVEGTRATLERSCGTDFLDWAGHPDGLLLLHLIYDGRIGELLEQVPGHPCEYTPEVADAWPMTTAGFRVDDDHHITLTDRSGGMVAELTRTSPVTPATRRAPTVAPLPDGIVPATRELLAGKWYLAGGGTGPEAIWMTWLQEGRRTPGDLGCEEPYYKWVGSPLGGLLDNPGDPQVGPCMPFSIDPERPSPTPPPRVEPPTGFARAGLDGDVLILFDAEGAELARLTRFGGPGHPGDPDFAQPRVQHPSALLRALAHGPLGALPPLEFTRTSKAKGILTIPTGDCTTRLDWVAHTDGRLELKVVEEVGVPACEVVFARGAHLGAEGHGLPGDVRRG